MQIIENWADITGTVHSCHPARDVEGFVAVEVAVERAATVEGFANLLAEATGTNLVILVPVALVQSLGLKAGDRLTCRVRRAGLDRIFVHQQHIAVQHAN